MRLYYCSMGQLNIVRHDLCVGVGVGAIGMDGRVGDCGVWRWDGREADVTGSWCHLHSLLFTYNVR